MTREKITGFSVFLISSLLILLPSICHGAEVYIWTDDQGVKHIEDTPPPISPKKKIKVDKYRFEKQSPYEKGALSTEQTPPSKPEKEEALEKAKELEKQRQARKEKEQRDKEIEKARQDYEAAQKLEAINRTRYMHNESSRARYLWKKSQQDAEEAKQRLEELESNQ